MNKNPENKPPVPATASTLLSRPFRENLRCDFTQDELLKKGDEIADWIAEVHELEVDKAEQAKSFKIKIDGLQADIAADARLIKDRYVMRDVECVAKFHHPKAGLKTIVRLDSGVSLRTESMTPEECQQKLVLVEETAAGESA